MCALQARRLTLGHLGSFGRPSPHPSGYSVLGIYQAIRSVVGVTLILGCSMNRKCALALLAAIAALSLSSCSGVNSVCTTNCNTGGNAKVTLTIFDTPPAGTTVLAFGLPIVGISLTPSSGSAVSVYSPSSVQPTELTRLQTDSSLIVSAASVPTGTYTALNITIGATSGIFINASGASITYKLNGSNVTCVNFQVCNLPAGAATTVNVPINLTLNNNQNQWMGIDVNLNKAILTTGGISVDFTQANVFTATTTPRVGLPTGAVDTIEDFTGKVTALANNSISVQNAITGQTLTATVVSGSSTNTQLNTAPASYSGCNNSNPATCILVGSTVSMNANVAADGTLTATEIDGLDVTGADEIEGVIYPTARAGVLGLILLDKASASGNSVLSASTTTFGTPFQLDATSNNVTYSVDTGQLTNSGLGTNPPGFSGTGSLLAGQVVRVQVANVSVVNNVNTATALNVLLRWSRLSATVNTAGGSAFTLTGIPAYMNALNSTLSLTPQVNSSPTYTAFDGITDASGITVGRPIAIRALFLDTGSGALYPFQAAKVRVP
jgi:hypothetical protein